MWLRLQIMNADVTGCRVYHLYSSAKRTPGMANWICLRPKMKR